MKTTGANLFEQAAATINEIASRRGWAQTKHEGSRLSTSEYIRFERITPSGYFSKRLRGLWHREIGGTLPSLGGAYRTVSIRIADHRATSGPNDHNVTWFVNRDTADNIAIFERAFSVLDDPELLRK